ncbi:MAG TPA: hypothetical protein VL995_12810 [Cellvibrio sp.]|nr:hypothetical protein [Cellvibrio sp.]
MKLIRWINVFALVLVANVAHASIVMPDLRVKEQIGNFNPKPACDKQTILQ